jgi:hypothetical protein
MLSICERWRGCWGKVDWKAIVEQNALPYLTFHKLSIVVSVTWLYNDATMKKTKYWWYAGSIACLVLIVLSIGCLIFSGSVGIFVSAINTSSSSSTTRSGNACIDFSNVAVRVQRENSFWHSHRLESACAKKIAEKLNLIPAIKQVKIIPHGQIIGKDNLLPSQIIEVNVGRYEEQWLPYRLLKANIMVSFGSSGVQYPCIYGDGGAPPLVQLEHDTVHDVQFKYTGICTESVFYDKIAEEVAKKTVETIEKEIGKLGDSASFLPKLPEAFYPAYREATDIPPNLDFFVEKTLIDGRRFMLPHYSLAQIGSNFKGTDDEFLNTIHAAMTEDGWYGHIQKSDNKSAPYMRLTKGEETFYMFKEKWNRHAKLWYNLQLETYAKDAPPHSFLLERTAKMDQDSILLAIQTLLDGDTPTSTLFVFANQLYGNKDTVQELQEQMRERFLEWKTCAPAEQLALVHFFNKDEDKEIAKAMLFKAWRVRQLAMHPVSDSDYTKLAKALGIEEEMKAMPQPTSELCEEYGFIYLIPENCPMEVEAELGKPVRFVTENEDAEGYLSLIQHTFRYENGVYHTKSESKKFSKHSWSSGSTSSSGQRPSIALGFSSKFTFSVIPNTSPIRMKVECQVR